MKRVVLIAILVAIIMASCKKNSDTALSPIQKTDYTQLEIGNYWVYDLYKTDSSGNEISSGDVDSCTITRDTVINGQQFYVKSYTYQAHDVFLRDSAGYLVDNLGKVHFSDHDFKNILRRDTIGPGLAYATYRMIESDTVITVPMGEFTALAFRGTITALDPQSQHGTQYTYYFYADGLGLFKLSYYYYNRPQMRIGKRLKEFGNLNTGKSSGITW